MRNYLAIAKDHGAEILAEDIGGSFLWRFEGDSSDDLGYGPFDTAMEAAEDLCLERGWK